MTDRRCRLGCSLLIAALLAIWGASGAAATVLRITVQGEQGQPLSVSSAELLVTAWGEARRIPLPVEGGRVVVVLDSAWLQERWPGRFGDVDEAFLFIRAEGGAAIASAPFQWIGMRADLGGHLVERAVIAFARHRPVTVARDEQVEFRLVLRREQERYLRFVDEGNNPVAGVLVRTQLFGSDKNHCGLLAGAELLDEATSDDAGRVRIPDGDFTYAFELSRRPYVLAAQPALGVQTMVARLSERETTVSLRRLAQVPLRLRVQRSGRQAADYTLYGVAAHCRCGACSGFLAQTDTNGEIREEEFYPQEFERIFLEDAQGRRVWQADPRAWKGEQRVDIEVAVR